MNLEARSSAIRSLSSLLAKGDNLHTDAFYDGLGNRLVANALLVRGYLAPVVESEKAQLKQQRTANYDDVDALEEDLHLLEQEIRAKAAMLVDARARRAREYDPDEVAQDREDRRDAEARHDERAAADAPRMVG